MALTKQERSALRRVTRRLEDLITPGKNRCSVKDEHKNAVRLYIRSWVLPLVRTVETPAYKRTLSERDLLKRL